MRRLVMVGLVMMGLLVVQPAAAQGPDDPCGDGVCDTAEQQNPHLCPKDCKLPGADTESLPPPFELGADAETASEAAATETPPDPEAQRQQERTYIAGVPAVQVWQQIAVISEPENFAPSVVERHEGGYRIYWNAAQSSGGIGSAVSEDGLTWTTEPGARLENGGSGALDCIASHPWVVAVEGGYRMYYQGNAQCGEVSGDNIPEPEYRIMSAFSSDGLEFEREGVVIDIGAETGLTQAAHGRVLDLGEHGYRMYFSANFIDKEGPADILGAYSTDGLTWALDPIPLLERGHDPTVIQVGDTIWLYASFLADNFLVLRSTDAYNFTPVAWVDFLDETGTRIENFGDADVLLLPDGRLVLIGSGKGTAGLGIFVRDL